MSKSLFITGASGFLGSYFLKEIDPARYKKIYLLVRDKKSIRSPLTENVQVVEGDLLEPSGYRQELAKSDTVVHMAAVTGKAKPGLHYKINARGTEQLIDACKTAGVTNFLHLSTIAVKFSNKKRYFYALAKEEAESIVKNSGLNYLIVRPTMIMGPGSAVFKGLETFAGLPVLPVFGTGRILVQPIHVRDMARVLCYILKNNQLINSVVEIGGKEAVTIETFLKNIHKSKKGKDPLVIHLPLGLIIAGLSIVEPLLYSLLPVTVGQLASFRNSGTADKSPVTDSLPFNFSPINEIITDSLVRAEAPLNTKKLEKECAVFSRYLVGMEPDQYILEKYLEIHKKKDMTAKTRFDRILLRIACAGPFFSKICDGYSRFFCPGSLVRKKLVFLFALLEISPPYYRSLDQSSQSSISRLIPVMAFKGIYFAFHLFVSAIFFLPIQLVFGRGSKNPKKGEE